MAITNGTKVGFSFGNAPPSNLEEGTFYIDQTTKKMSLAISGNELLEFSAASNKSITCTELGLDIEDTSDNNLSLLAMAINKGYEIIVDKMYQIKKIEKDEVKDTYIINHLNTEYISLIGKNQECGFEFLSTDTNTLHGGQIVFGITETCKTLYLKNLTIKSSLTLNNVSSLHRSLILFGVSPKKYYLSHTLPETISIKNEGRQPSSQLTTSNLDNFPYLDSFTMQQCIIDGPITALYYLDPTVYSWTEKDNENNVINYRFSVDYDNSKENQIKFKSVQQKFGSKWIDIIDLDKASLEYKDYGIKYINIINNKFVNSNKINKLYMNTGSFQVWCPNVFSIVANNIVHNHASIFFENALNNNHPWTTQRKGSCEIKNNKSYCDDDFFREDLNPTEYHRSNSTNYYCFALIENDRIFYHHNHVEGMKLDLRSSNLELYDLYANAKEVYYHHNVWKNIFKARTQFYSEDGVTWSYIGRWQLIQAKGSTYPKGMVAGIREYCNNQFIIEEDFLKRIKWHDIKNNIVSLTDETYDNFIKKYMPRLILTTTFQKTIKIDNNIIDMPNLLGTGGDPMYEQFIFTNNTLKLNYLTNGLIYTGNRTVASNSEISTDRSVIFNNNNVVINSASSNFTLKDENDEDEKNETLLSAYAIFYDSGIEPKQTEILNNCFDLSSSMTLFLGQSSNTINKNYKTLIQNNVFKYNSKNERLNHSIYENFSSPLHNNTFIGTLPIIYKGRCIPSELNFDFKIIDMNNSDDEYKTNTLYLTPKYQAENALRTLGKIGDKTIQDYMINSTKPLNTGVYRIEVLESDGIKETTLLFDVTMSYEEYYISIPATYDEESFDSFKKIIACVVSNIYTGNIKTSKAGESIPILLPTYTFQDDKNQCKIVYPFVSYIYKDNITHKVAYNNFLIPKECFVLKENEKLNEIILHNVKPVPTEGPYTIPSTSNSAATIIPELFFTWNIGTDGYFTNSSVLTLNYIIPRGKKIKLGNIKFMGTNNNSDTFESKYYPSPVNLSSENAEKPYGNWTDTIEEEISNWILEDKNNESENEDS